MMRDRSVLLGVCCWALCWGSHDLATAQIVFPMGTQDFESLAVGESVSVLNWVVVNSSVPPENFTVTGTDTPFPPPGSNSTRWIRIVDGDDGDVQNRFYSPPIETKFGHNYTWKFFVLLETAPPGNGAVKPRFTIQHFDGGFSNAWGIELANDATRLFVTGSGGNPDSTLISGALALNEWIPLRISVDFDAGSVSGTVGSSASASLPIALAGDPTAHRFCYRGEGVGNVLTALLDDVSFQALGSADVATFESSKDNTLYEDPTGALSNGEGPGFFVGRTSLLGGTAIRRGLVAFTLTGEVPPGSLATSAELRLQLTQTQSNIHTVQVHRALQDWGESDSVGEGMGGGQGGRPADDDATWIHTFFPDAFWNNAGGDFANASASESIGGLGPYTFASGGLTADVQGWLDDATQNFGWLLTGNEANASTTKRFATREATTPSFRPQLTVQFLPAFVTPTLPAFIRADADGNGVFNGLQDSLFILAFQFQGGDAPPCLEAADADGDGVQNGLNDALYVLAFQFQFGPAPPPPHPACGHDPDRGASLGCESHPGCP